MVVSDVGALQGTVLAPFLFTQDTSDFQYNSESAHLQKFLDDTAVIGCVSGGQEGEYRALLNYIVEWSGRNHLLLLDVAKTRQMVIDIRKKRTATQPLNILGEDIEVVKDYKDLG